MVVILNTLVTLLWTVLHHEVITVKVCLYLKISGDKPTFAEFRITTIPSFYSTDSCFLIFFILFLFIEFRFINVQVQMGTTVLYHSTMDLFLLLNSFIIFFNFLITHQNYISIIFFVFISYLWTNEENVLY